MCKLNWFVLVAITKPIIAIIQFLYEQDNKQVYNVSIGYFTVFQYNNS